MAEGTRLAEMLGSLSLATDLAAGLPAETAVRTSVLAVRLAAARGAQGFELSDAYYTGLLRFLGCSAYSYEMAERFAAGDDLSLIRELTYADTRKPKEALKAAARGIDPTAPLRKRGAAFLRFASSPGMAKELFTTHCELAVLLARRLGMAEGVVGALSHIYEHWNGGGAPACLRGDAIRTTSRVVQVAWRLAAHYALGGPREAIDGVLLRRGTELDPQLVDVAEREQGALFEGVHGAELWRTFLDAEPRPSLLVATTRALSVARVFADFADVKSPWTVGHSAKVAELASAASQGDTVLELAGLLHDIGRTAVPNGIWDKRGALGPDERTRMQTHTFETERVLSRSPLFADVAALASMAHERIDGTGYHRGLRTTGLGRQARLLAAADTYAALVQDRPHRAAKTPAQAGEVLAADARAGRLCADAVDAVLAAAGHVRGRRAAVPHALTPRELEIVGLVARGLANKEIAAKTELSPRTVKRHLENIYGKIGLRTRAAVSVWALENDLL